MRLEDLRLNDIGTVSAWLPRLGSGPNSMTQLTYPDFAESAFYLSVQQIEQLEFSTDFLQPGNGIQTTVGLWFISIEAYINSLLRICCLATGHNFNDLKSKDFGPRIRTVLKMLAVDGVPFYKGPFQRLEEFKSYRNELFHDRTSFTQLAFYKTHFSGNPMLANQVDVMQAAVIALETYQAFRYVVPGVDLMPQVKATKLGLCSCLPLDRLYTDILHPFFKNTLTKHCLDSSLSLVIEMEPLPTSSIFQNGDVEVLIKAIPDKEFNYCPSPQQTNILNHLVNSLGIDIPYDPAEYIQLPNYYRR